MSEPGKTKFPSKILAWRRIVVKLSGEALMGTQSHGLDQDTLARIAADLKSAAARGVEVAVVVGGGNFFAVSKAPTRVSNAPVPIRSACWRR